MTCDKQFGRVRQASLAILAILLSYLLIYQLFIAPVAVAFASETPESQNATLAYSFTGLDDPRLAGYINDEVYSELIDQLPDGYYIQNIDTTYVSREYLEESAYNAQSNIYFGYTLDELNELFDGSKYVFTLGEDGQTTVEAFEGYNDATEQMMKKVAVGAGVILLTATVSAATAGATTPALSLVFMLSSSAAKDAAFVGISTGAVSGAISGIVTGMQTGNVDQALEAAKESAADGFAMGAVSGALLGGAGRAKALIGATENGLSAAEVAMIQKESKYPLDVIREFKSIDEYNVYRNAGLNSEMVGGRSALVRDVNPSYKAPNQSGVVESNLERMREGRAPIDPATGESYELHHVNQNADGTLAILTQEEHRKGVGGMQTLHEKGKSKGISKTDWATQREQFWRAFAATLE